jgi:uncharacterized RDD family membrane protein YckC
VSDDRQPNPARWAQDPTGRHEYRYWDGSAWTANVADQGRPNVDPVDSPSGVVVQSSPGIAPPVAATGARTQFSRSQVGDPTAVMGRRYLAFFIDVAISLVAFGIIFVPLATRRSVDETLQLPGCYRSLSDSSQVRCDNRAVFQVGDTVYESNGGGFFLAAAAFTLLYFGLLEGLTGATLGKRVSGIRVVKEDGSIEGFGKALLRWLVFLVDGPLSLFLCGIITSASSRGHRRLGDMAASTYVVAAKQVGQPVHL